MDDQVRILARQLLHEGYGPLTPRERRMIERIARRVGGPRPPEAAETVGERLADRVAAVGGSWGFVLGAVGFLALWAALNAWLLGTGAWDPYPFVFLNLLLSMLAALQAPIIMMSQNRQAAKDRAAARRDAEVTLRAEVGIAALLEKVDRLQQGVDALDLRGPDERPARSEPERARGRAA